MVKCSKLLRYFVLNLCGVHILPRLITYKGDVWFSMGFHHEHGYQLAYCRYVDNKESLNDKEYI